MRKPERTHVYIGRCPDCGAPKMITSAMVGWESSTAYEVAAAIAAGQVITSMTHEEYRALGQEAPFPTACKEGCRRQRIRPCCIHCGDVIYDEGEQKFDQFISGDEMLPGNFMQLNFHTDCWREIDVEATVLDGDWGSGERPEGPGKERDAQIAARLKEIAAGQMEMPL